MPFYREASIYEMRTGQIMKAGNKFITIGIAGHVDHGKTSLVKALTGIDTDRLKEEKQRGLSIESGVAVFPSEDGISIAIIDVPGHIDFLKNTIRGLSCVDFGILVVAADDGVMPQTLEHVQILELNGVTEGIIVLSKADLVDIETLELAELEIRDALKDTFLGDKAVFTYSNVTQHGLGKIRDAVLDMSKNLPLKDPGLPFRMWIDRVKGFKGFGTVVSGTVLSGTLKKDEPLILMPDGKSTRARTLESHHETITKAVAGQRVGINLHKLPVTDIKRGMVVASLDSLKPSYMFNAHLNILKNTGKSIHNRKKVKLYIGTCLVKATIVIMEKELLNPGEEGFIQLRLSDPVAVLPGDNFIIKAMNIPVILGGGKVIEITYRKYRKAIASDIIASQKALINKDVGSYIDIQTTGDITSLIRAEDLAINTGLSLKDLKNEINKKVNRGEFMDFGKKGVLKQEAYKRVKSDLPEIFRKIQEENPMKHKVNQEEIKDRLPFSFPSEPLERILIELSNEGVLVKENGGYLLSGFSPDLSEEHDFMVSFILEYAAESGITPFSPDTIWRKNNCKYPKKKIKKILSFLRSRKRLVKVNDGRFLTFEAIEQIKSLIKKVIKEKGVFTLSDCGPVLGYGRTVAIPILEYLDEKEFTVRVKEGRILKEEKDGL